jgi:HEAT repeat protein
MLTDDAMQERIAKFIDNSQLSTREKLTEDINFISHYINSYSELLNAINDSSLSVHLRTRVCWLMSKIGDLDSVPFLLTATDDHIAAIRAQAVQALGELNVTYPDVLTKILTLLKTDEDTDVRVRVAYSLGLIAHESTLMFLVDTLTNEGENSSVRGMAAESLVSFHDPSVIPILIEALSDKSGEVRFWCAFALGQLGAIEALPVLERLVAEDHEEIQGWHKVSQEAASAILAIKASI